MKYNKKRYSDLFPQDVKAIMDLFPDLQLCIGDRLDYFDVDDGKRYVFLQPIPHIIGEGLSAEKNRRRFISWVRAGMPEGHSTYETVWEKEE